jgi:hypothetical protein
MNKLKATILAFVLVTVVGTPLYLQYQANKSLRNQNEALLPQVSQLSELEAENERLSKRARSAATNSISGEQKRELARLRSEVTRLRAETNQAERMRQEIDRLRPTRTEPAKTQSPNAAQPDNFPRETWAFAGYGTPETAIQSLSWASLRGDLDTFFKSMAPEEQARIRKQWESQGKGDAEIRDFLINYWAQTKAIRIEERQAISDNEAMLSLFIERENGRSQRMKMKIQRLGNEWKVAGTRPHETDGDIEVIDR